MDNIRVQILDDSCVPMMIEMLSDCTPLRYAETDTSEDLQTYFDQGQLVVGIFVEAELAAYAVFSMRHGNKLAEFFAKYNVITVREVCEDVGTLRTCVVKDKFRGRGFQLALIRIREEGARHNGYHQIFTSVHEKNTYSINNLIKAGYKRAGRHSIQSNWLLYGKALDGPACFKEQG